MVWGGISGCARARSFPLGRARAYLPEGRNTLNPKLQATGVATLARGVGRAISELPHADQGTEEGLWPEEACLVFILIGVRLV